MNYEDYVVERFDFYNEYETKNEYYLKSKKSLYSYNSLFNQTINDIKNKILL